MAPVRFLSAAIFFNILFGLGISAIELSRHAYIDYVKCQFNPEYLSNGTCKLSFTDRLHKSLTVNTFINRTVETAIVHHTLFYHFQNGYKMFLINVKTNLCDYRDRKINSTILDLFMPILDAHSNPNLNCPVWGSFIVENIPVNGAIWNYQFIPVGKYLYNITVASGQDIEIWSGKFYFTIPEGKTIEDDSMGRR